MQGIDPISLDMLAREGIVALRRAKRRNMERYVMHDCLCNLSWVRVPCDKVDTGLWWNCHELL